MYIKEEDGKVIIYKVVISDELKKIRDEIIEKFSKITEYEEERTSWNESETKKEKIEVISYDYTGKVKEYRDFYSCDERIYLVKFRKYKYPDIVVYINEFLDGNFKNLYKLRELMQAKKIYKLNDKNREYTKSLLPYKEYIKKIISCLKLEIIEEKYINSIEELINLLSSLEDKKLDEISKLLSKRLKEDSKKLNYLWRKNND